MADKTRTQVVDAFNAAGMPTGPVYTAEDVFADDHFRVRGMLAEVDDPEVGPFTFARSVPHLSAAPEIPLDAAPALGAHTRDVLVNLLGYPEADVEGLAAGGVVGLPTG
jgi:formyl-CoA transferase